MAFSKQQIAKTANYISQKLISSEDEKLQQWFSKQFKQAIKESSHAVQLKFSSLSQDFRQLRDLMGEKGIFIPDGLEVCIHNMGKTTVSINGAIQLTFYGMDQKPKDSWDLNKLHDLLEISDDESISSEEDWESDYKAPPPLMLSQYLGLEPRSSSENTESEVKELTPRLERIKV